MRNVLIVSPHFPPVDLPDMHRVRVSLPYFREFGWHPTVLTVAPRFVEGAREPLYGEPDSATVRTAALPARWTRMAGLGNLGLRAFPFLYSAASGMLARGAFDLIYFSTTVFTSVPLGRLWKRRFGVPFVVDMQDPWVNDYYDRHPGAKRPPKYGIASRLHRVLEPWSMPAADGIIAVSRAYIDTLSARYPALAGKPSMVLPFGAASKDFERLRPAGPNRFFDPADGGIHAVYAGRGGDDMWPALRLVFAGLAQGLRESPEIFGRLRLHFIGTDYAPAGRTRKSIEPLAESMGVGAHVREHSGRVPYFEALQILRDAHMLLLPGSDDPQYTPSKLYPYILGRKPLLAVLHPRSEACEEARSVNAGKVVTLDDDGALYPAWREILSNLSLVPEIDWQAFERFSAREMTRRQCEFFDGVIAHSNAQKHNLMSRDRTRALASEGAVPFSRNS